MRSSIIESFRGGLSGGSLQLVSLVDYVFGEGSSELGCRRTSGVSSDRTSTLAEPERGAVLDRWLTLSFPMAPRDYCLRSDAGGRVAEPLLCVRLQQARGLLTDQIAITTTDRSPMIAQTADFWTNEGIVTESLAGSGLTREWHLDSRK